MHFKRSAIPLLTFSIIANVLMLVAPLHMMQVYDRVLASGSKETLFFITLIAAVALVLFGVCEAIRNRLAQRLAAQYAVENAETLFQGVTSNGAGHSQDMIRNFNTVKMFLASRAYIGLFDLPFAPMFLIILFLIHYQIGLLTLVGAVLLVGVAFLNKSLTATDQAESVQANSKAINFATNVISRAEDIKAMGLLPQLVQRWGLMTGVSINSQDRATAKSAFYMGLSRSIRQILQISIMGWGAFLVLNGDMSGGLIFAASMVSGRALQPIEQVIGGWENIARAQSAYTALEEFLIDEKDKTAPIEQPVPLGNLEVSEISYNPNDVKVLENVSVSIRPGEMLSIVGPSGAGKSTLARIVAGAIEPSFGSVSLDGCDLKNWPTHQWGQFVGYVGQEVILFPGTIAENIARMALAPEDARVIAAAKTTGVHDLINQLPDGYMTQIGADNVRLSGGQIQRIALARALYSSPRLLVLDEPNAHLDANGEAALYNILKTLKQRKVSIVIVTQKGRLAELADKTLTIKDGASISMQVNRSIAPPMTTPKVHVAKPIGAAQ